MQDKPKANRGVRTDGSVQKNFFKVYLDRNMSKGHRSQMKELSLAKAGAI